MPDRSATAAVLRAGALTAVADGFFSSALNVFAYGSTVTRLFQGVASVPLGASALEGGAATAAAGIALHVGVAFAWSLVFLLVARTLPAVRRALRSRAGVVVAAAVYGPAVWLAMSLVVIPLFTGRPPAITYRWWIQLAGHAVFVGLPIVTSVAPAVADRAAPRT